MPAAFGTQLDATNRQLIAALQDDARLSLAELGRRVGLTAPAVGERLARLEDAGVIRGYHADVDPDALGYGLDVILRIRPAPRMIHKVAELAARRPRYRVPPGDRGGLLRHAGCTSATSATSRS